MEVSSVTVIGGSALVIIIAPLPALDYEEVPFSLVAETLAHTLSPQSKLKGVALRLST